MRARTHDLRRTTGPPSTKGRSKDRRRGETTVLFAVIAVSAGYPNEVAGEGNQRQGYSNRNHRSGSRINEAVRSMAWASKSVERVGRTRW
jgi:hypothetical protein